MRHNPNDAERFWARVEKTEGCWNWTGRSVRAVLEGVQETAHRVAWRLTHGSDALDDGDVIVIRTCNNDRCVNPAHLALNGFTDTDRERITALRAQGVPMTEIAKRQGVHYERVLRLFNGSRGRRKGGAA